MTKYEVGQKVLLFSGLPREKDREVTVTRVGRKNVYVEVYGREYPFNMDTGVEVRGANAIGSPDHIRTYEQHAEDIRRKQATARLSEHGFVPKGYSGWNWPTEVLEKIVGLLDELEESGQ